MRSLFVTFAVMAAGLAAGPAAAAGPSAHPDPFAGIDLTTWYLAEYLSGSQKDDARLLFMQQLPRATLDELVARCRTIEPDMGGYEDSVRLVCDSAYAVMNRQ